MMNKVYDKNYYYNIWNIILRKYTPDSPVYDLGDVTRQHYVAYFIKKFLDARHSACAIRIMDFGAGNWLYLGEILDVLTQYCQGNNAQIEVELIGVDYSGEAMQFGVQKYKERIPSNVKIKTMTGEINQIAAGVEKESCDLVLSLETLEHLYEDKQLVEKIHRMLKPDGTVIVSVPNEKPAVLSKNWFIYALFRKKFSEKDQIVGHLRRYGVCSLYKMAEKTGLQVLEHQCYGFICSDYLKTLISIVEKYFPSKLPDVFMSCRKFVQAENAICNRMHYQCSEGIFVFMQKEVKE